MPTSFKHTRESDQEQMAEQQTCCSHRCFPAGAATFLFPRWTIWDCYTFLLSNQSSTLPPVTHGVVAIYLHGLMRSWLRRTMLTHKAEGFYVCTYQVMRSPTIFMCNCVLWVVNTEFPGVSGMQSCLCRGASSVERVYFTVVWSSYCFSPPWNSSHNLIAFHHILELIRIHKLV